MKSIITGRTIQARYIDIVSYPSNEIADGFLIGLSQTQKLVQDIVLIEESRRVNPDGSVSVHYERPSTSALTGAGDRDSVIRLFDRFQQQGKAARQRQGIPH